MHVRDSFYFCPDGGSMEYITENQELVDLWIAAIGNQIPYEPCPPQLIEISRMP